jgi:hypothetical protein
MSTGAYDDDGDAVIEMDLLPPRWLDVQDEITEQLAHIARQTRKLDQLHQKHVLPGFDDEDVKKREERDIEQLTQDITRSFQRCQQAIKRIDAMVRDAKQQGHMAQGDAVMAQNLKISLASRVGEVSAMFRKKQSAYLKSESPKCRYVYTHPHTHTQTSHEGVVPNPVQSCATSEASPRPSAPPRPSRTPITTLRCRSLTPTAPSRSPRCSRPSSSACATTPTRPSLPNVSTRSSKSHRALSSLQTSSRSCRQWSSTKAPCSTASTTTSIA